MNKHECGLSPRPKKGRSAAERNRRGVADEGFTLDPVWRKEAVFSGNPTATDNHATGNETKEFGEFATRNMFRLHSFDGEIDFGCGFLGKSAVGIHSLSTTSSVAPLGIMILTLVLTSC